MDTEKKQFFKEYFLVDNKSGYKTKDKHVKTHFPELYEALTQFISINKIDMDISFKEKIYLFLHDLPEIPKCLNCGENLKFGRALSEPYRIYCSMKCSNKDEKRIENFKKTIEEKYGGYVMNDETIRKKMEATNLERYGVTNIFFDTEYIRKKNLESLGVSNPNKLDSVKEKRKKTNLKKYGIENHLQLENSRNKRHKKVLEGFDEKYNTLNIINNKGSYIDILCSECEKEYNIYRSTLHYRFDNNVNPCTHCNPLFEHPSIKEKDLRKFVVSTEVEFIENDREVLSGKELDIYIPHHQIAIEFNGLYYHSDKFVDKEYHLNKTLECETQGIQLIHIFEDEWIHKKNIVKSIINNILQKNPYKIFARKCNIREVKTKEKTEFLNQNHIQGATGSTVNLGLYHGEELVSIMTFGKKRLVLGNKQSKEGEYELLRFCNKLNTSVLGGASKLFKYFISNYNPRSIISFADRRWSRGNLYNVLGFEFDYDTVPNYFYVKAYNREHRFKYRKSELIKEGFDPQLTEKEIMKQRGFNRIYDCGSKRYVYRIK